MKGTRHNGRSGKDGVYNPLHNDRRFDPEHSEHIDNERVRQNIYWDCYQGYTTMADRGKEDNFSFNQIELAYYVEHYSDYVMNQNARHEKARHPDRCKGVEDVLKSKKTCPEESIYQLGTIDEHASAETLVMIFDEFKKEFDERFGSNVHIIDWSLHMDEATPHIHERHVFDATNRYGEIEPKQEEALKQLGFADVYETAIGADIGAATEARHYVEHVTTGELPFLLTSCCPAWAMLAKNQFPEMIDSVSQELTPMVATARSIKKEHPKAKVVFIGPCASKKLEAMRKSVRSDVDFVITFEELDAMFEAKHIDPATVEAESNLHNATGAGRGYAVAGGVADAIRKCVNEYYPGVDVKVEHAEGLAECKKTLLLAKAGKFNGCLIEGMGCPGGCVAGAGTLLPVPEAKRAVAKIVADSTKKLPPKELQEIELK